MPYKYTGDYYRHQVGDPFLGAALRIGAGLLGKALPVGKRIVQRLLGRARIAKPVAVGVAAGAGFETGARLVRGRAEEFAPRRRRINPANAKALRRSIRRVQGFVKLARRSVGVLGLKVSRRGASKGPR